MRAEWLRECKEYTGNVPGADGLTGIGLWQLLISNSDSITAGNFMDSVPDTKGYANESIGCPPVNRKILC